MPLKRCDTLQRDIWTETYFSHHTPVHTLLLRMLWFSSLTRFCSVALSNTQIQSTHIHTDTHTRIFTDRHTHTRTHTHTHLGSCTKSRNSFKLYLSAVHSGPPLCTLSPHNKSISVLLHFWIIQSQAICRVQTLCNNNSKWLLYAACTKYSMHYYEDDINPLLHLGTRASTSRHILDETGPRDRLTYWLTDGRMYSSQQDSFWWVCGRSPLTSLTPCVGAGGVVLVVGVHSDSV